MCSMRVATFAFSANMINASERIDSKMQQLQIQQASNQISTDYGGLGAVAGQVLNLQTSASQATAFAANASLVNSRVQTMYSTLTSVTDVITNFKSTLSAISSTTNPANLAQQAASARDNLVSLLNTQFNGRYLFAGNQTATPPVDLTGQTYDPTTLDTPQTGYYQGNNDIQSVRVSQSQTVNYGVTANQPGFEAALRVFASLAGATAANTNSTTIADALTQLSTAMDNILVSQTGLSAASSTLTTAVQTQQDYATTAGELVSSDTEINIASVTAQFSAYQAQLEASYSALAKISSVNLMQYEK